MMMSRKIIHSNVFFTLVASTVGLIYFILDDNRLNVHWGSKNHKI